MKPSLADIVNLCGLAIEIWDRIGPSGRNHDSNLLDTDDELWEQHSFVAERLVSLWSHVMLADGRASDSELETIDNMLLEFVNDDDHFPGENVDKQVVYDELRTFLRQPLPLSDVVEWGSQDKELSIYLFAQACVICAADGILRQKESSFLNVLSKSLKLSSEEKNRIEQMDLRGVRRETLFQKLFGNV